MGDLDQGGDGVLVGEGAVLLEVSGRGDLDGGGHVVELVAAAALRSRTCGKGIEFWAPTNDDEKNIIPQVGVGRALQTRLHLGLGQVEGFRHDHVHLGAEQVG